MAISFACPSCAKPYKVKDELAGKRAACTQCKKIMTVPKVSSSLAATESHAIEALATAALGEAPAAAAEVAAGTDIPLECPFCFEKVAFAPDKAGKQAPCPQCRRLVKVPVPQTTKPRANWRAAEHNFTMARKVDQLNPDGAWGNAALNQAVVSREALLEAEVILDRKAMAAPDRTKLFTTLGVLLLVGIVGGWWYWRGKAADERRMGLIADAVQAADPKTTTLPPGWPAAVHIAAGEFWLNELPPDLKQAVKHLQQARDAVGKVESPVDRAGLLTAIALVQANLVGDDTASAAKKALPWDDAQRELRQTLQRFQELPREHAWYVIEALTRKLQAVGLKRPLMVSLAPVPFAAESDRADALACVALTLRALGNDQADAIGDEARTAFTGEGPPPVRLVALMLARKMNGPAAQIIPEVRAEEPPPAYRMAYAEGMARSGEPANLERGRKLAVMAGPVEQAVAAYALFADGAVDAGHPEELDAAVAFVGEKAGRFTLPPWALDRLANACVRAEKPALARQLADASRQPLVKPWLELAAFRAELASNPAAADPETANRIGEKTPAQGLGWVALARHNTRGGRGEPRSVVSVWTLDAAKAVGLAGAGLGVQDRTK